MQTQNFAQKCIHSMTHVIQHLFLSVFLKKKKKLYFKHNLFLHILWHDAYEEETF